MDKKIGAYSFIVGIIIAVILGVAIGLNLSLGAQTTAWLTSILIILGLLVGFLNVTGKDTKDFLLVSTVLVIVAYAGGASSALGSVEIIGPVLKGVFDALLAFVVPATVIVALKELVELAQSP